LSRKEGKKHEEKWTQPGVDPQKEKALPKIEGLKKGFEGGEWEQKKPTRLAPGEEKSAHSV